MNDEQALLAAIRANPEEDTPRLVYADWLDENARQKRAAFIRADVSRAQWAHGETSTAALAVLLEKSKYLRQSWLDWSDRDVDLERIRQAEVRIGKAVVKPTVTSENLPVVAGVKYGRLERGFFSTLVVSDPDALLAHADTLFGATPVTGVEFTRLSVAQAKSFLATGYLSRTRHLGFAGRVVPEAMRLLGARADAAGVRSLFLNLNSRAADRLEALVAGTRWAGVTRLELTGTDYEDETESALAALLRAPQFKGLRSFRAVNSDLSAEAYRALANGGLTELRYIDLSSTYVDESGAGALASAKALPNLRYLDLTEASPGPSAAARLIRSPKLPNLAVLLLSHTGGLDAKELSKPSRGPALRGLRLDWASLKDPTELAALGPCPALRGLWYLEFVWCNLTNAGLAALTGKAGFRELAVLELDEHRLPDSWVKALANCPALSRLQAFRNTANAINEPGARALVASPYLQGIKHFVGGGGGYDTLRKHFGKRVVF